jgi:hypothetical protein
MRGKQADEKSLLEAKDERKGGEQGRLNFDADSLCREAFFEASTQF